MHVHVERVLVRAYGIDLLEKTQPSSVKPSQMDMLVGLKAAASHIRKPVHFKSLDLELEV